MPAAGGLIRHGAHEPREATRDAPRLPRDERDPTLCPTDDEAAVPRRKGIQSKQSLDYLWRSGVAGGMAGCVVGSPSLAHGWNTLVNSCSRVGQNNRRTAR